MRSGGTDIGAPGRWSSVGYTDPPSHLTESAVEGKPAIGPLLSQWSPPTFKVGRLALHTRHRQKAMQGREGGSAEGKEHIYTLVSDVWKIY